MNLLDELLRRAYDVGNLNGHRDGWGMHDPGDPEYVAQREEALRAIVSPAHVGAQSFNPVDEE